MSAPVNVPTEAEIEETARIALAGLGVDERDMDAAMELYRSGAGTPSARVEAAAAEVIARRTAVRH